MLGEVQVRKNLAHLLAGLDIAVDIPSVDVSDVVLDSRQVTPGALFVACAGEQQHGLDYAGQAEDAGAGAIIWEAGGRAVPDRRIPCVAVPDLSQRAGEIAARFFDRPSEHLFMAGVTGTDGKTSCAWLISRALEVLGTRCGYLGTLGFGAVDELDQASHTTPDAVRLQRWLARMVAAGFSGAAMEVSSHALAQGRTDEVAFDVAVLTRIGRDHLDYHGNEAAYIAAKRRLFDSSGLGWAVLNADDEVGRQWLGRPADGVRRFAYGHTVDAAGYAYFVRIAKVDARSDGLVVDFQTHLGDARVTSRLIGTFNADNLAAILAVLLVWGIPLSDAAAALAAVPTVPGRMERVDAGHDQPLVIVDYAHTPDALEAALGALSAHVKGRLLCVFGCGGDRDRGKRAFMGAAAARYADYFWITDDNPRHEDPAAIVSDVLEGIPEAVMAAMRYEIVHARGEAIAQAISGAGPGDAVLIAGKGHENTQQYGDERRAFDDRVAARLALEAA